MKISGQKYTIYNIIDNSTEDVHDVEYEIATEYLTKYEVDTYMRMIFEDDRHNKDIVLYDYDDPYLPYGDRIGSINGCEWFDYGDVVIYDLYD